MAKESIKARQRKREKMVAKFAKKKGLHLKLLEILLDWICFRKMLHLLG